MRGITRELMASGPQSATATIQKALQDAGLSPAPPAASQQVPPPAQTPIQAAPPMRDLNAPPVSKAGAARAATAAPAPEARHGLSPVADADSPGTTLGSKLGEILQGIKQSGTGVAGLNDQIPDLLKQFGVGADGAVTPPRVARPGKGVTVAEGAQYIAGSYTNAAGTRPYKLYIPAGYGGQSLPLVVMLHGCTQDPDDFARGTQMNGAAERHQCLVLYPQQPQSANSSKCWNWFNAGDQQRDGGEPSIISDMTREVASRYHCDMQQIYIAGLSAGGAMAAIMGTVYPDLYAGVGVHSGLPYGSASDLPSALAAMRSGMSGTPARVRTGNAQPVFKGIPVIVFHGDADHTVNARNGEQVITSNAPPQDGSFSQTRTEGSVVNGHAYTRTVQQDGSGNPVAEHWLVHGFGHAWSGGDAGGSFTDAKGPDATGEMMRFFYTQKNFE
ncbi:MAG: PHB depolymerase family esterase [Herminiimonas sp.]|nr:PHB depolymerase family esterase [Herminiimonas sp.]